MNSSQKNAGKPYQINNTINGTFIIGIRLSRVVNNICPPTLIRLKNFCRNCRNSTWTICLNLSNRPRNIRRVHDFKTVGNFISMADQPKVMFVNGFIDFSSFDRLQTQRVHNVRCFAVRTTTSIQSSQRQDKKQAPLTWNPVPTRLIGIVQDSILRKKQHNQPEMEGLNSARPLLPASHIVIRETRPQSLPHFTRCCPVVNTQNALKWKIFHPPQPPCERMEKFRFFEKTQKEGGIISSLLPFGEVLSYTG